jgi:nucleotide-binding universal stress UspA family protein
MRDIKRILCPVDLSDESAHAIDHAIVIARWYKATITALHVCNPLVIPATDVALVGAGVPPILTEEDIKDASDRVAACLDSAADGHLDVPVDVLVESGPPAKQILARAKSLAADMIVIGTHGHSGFQHLVLGSVTEKVLRQAECPVLTIPPRARATSKLPFKSILCPIDFSDSSLSALDFALSLAREGDAGLTILHVLEFPDMPLTNQPVPTLEYRRVAERDVTTKLAQLVPDADRERCHPMTRLGDGKAYREILEVATEVRADLIVIGVHGRNPLDLMLLGSTTNQVVRRATCPVLTLRD